jgi:hypothetical protein
MEDQKISIRKFIYGHVSPETAYMVDDYPWGFRLRTTIRYWVESKATKNGGQRFCSQTINPKTGEWCKPKYSTYSLIVVMYLDEKNHVQWDCLHNYNYESKTDEFKKIHWDSLDEFQKDQLRLANAWKKVMQHVKVEVIECPIGPVSLFSKDPAEVAKREALIKHQEERKKEREIDERKILGAVNYYYDQNKTSMV